MTNLVITSTANLIKVDFNDQPFTDTRDDKVYASGVWSKIGISNIKLHLEGNCIAVMERDDFEWFVSQDGTEDTFTIDSIDGVVPVDNEDLYEKLISLIE